MNLLNDCLEYEMKLLKCLVSAYLHVGNVFKVGDNYVVSKAKECTLVMS